jgi:hypothetical protein
MRWPPREDVPAWVVALLVRVSAGGGAVMGIQVGWAAARWTFRSGREGEQAVRLVEYVNRPRLGIASLPKINCLGTQNWI